MTDTRCLHFENCEAPICPKDESSMKNCAWFPDEEFCRKHDVPPWVKAQRKIARRTKRDWTKGCFNLAMLSVNCVITGGIRGLDADSEIPWAEQIAKWLKNHPPKPEISEERKNEVRTRFKPFRKAVEELPEGDAAGG